MFRCGVFHNNVHILGGVTMANKTSYKVPINKVHFLKVVELRKCSVRKLGEAYEQVGRTEKTIRRCLNEGKMPPDLLDKIAKYLNVHPDYLAGIYDDRADRIEDANLRAFVKSSIKLEKYPYILKAKDKLNYVSCFEDILIMNNISMEQFNTLSAEERILFRQEMDVAILEVIAKHFKKNSLGKSVRGELEHCKLNVGDYDPFSGYAHLEGIGLPDPNPDDIFPDLDGTEIQEKNKSDNQT